MARKEKDIQIISARVRDWTIPHFGNTHSVPYGSILVKGVVDGKEAYQTCKTRGDKYTDNTPQFIVFQGERFKVRNLGTMHCPKIELERWHKEKIGNRWLYVA